MADSDNKKITELLLGVPVATDIFPYVSSPGSSPVVKKSLISSMGGSSLIGSRGLVGINNSGTPNTQFDFTADFVALRDPTTGNVVVATNTGAITNNIALPASGSTPTANGCDQIKISGLTSRWVHFYWIWNGSTLATVASLTAPPTGPTLPSGYTHWAYIGAVRLNGSSQLVPTYLRGNKAYYQTRQLVVNSGAATTETAVDIAAFIPPNASTWTGTYSQIKATATAGGVISFYTVLRIFTGVEWILEAFDLSGLSNGSVAGFGGPTFEAPNIGQSFYYFSAISGGTSPTVIIYVLGYGLPNGG